MIKQTFLIAGLMSITIGVDAFAAPSVRTAATPQQTQTAARAGILRGGSARTGAMTKQTIKNTTVPSASYTASPESNERLVAIKTKIPSKTSTSISKDAIESRIEELQEAVETQKIDKDAIYTKEEVEQLIQSETEKIAEQHAAEKSNMYTKEEVEQLIQAETQKITEQYAAEKSNMYTKEEVDQLIQSGTIGTTTPSETYTKTEVNELLGETNKKLPQIDDRGNMTWTDPNGNLVSNSIYYMNLVYTADLKFPNFALTNYGTFYMYETNKTDSAIQQYVSSTVCNGETSDWCWISNMDPNAHIGNGRAVSVVRLNHGYGPVYNSIYWGFDPLSNLEERDTTHTIYWTFEDSPATYVRNAVCGGKPESDCFVATGNMQAFGGAVANGVTFSPDYTSSKVGTLVEIVERGQHTGNDFENSLGWESFHLVKHYMVSAASSVTQQEINTYVNKFCNGESNFYCYILNGEINTLSTGTKQFVIVKRLHGYGLLDSHIIHDNGNILFNKIFYTNEINPDTYIRDTICGRKPTSECYVAEWWNMLEINNSNVPGSGERDARYQVSLIEVPIAPKPGEPQYITYER